MKWFLEVWLFVLWVILSSSAASFAGYCFTAPSDYMTAVGFLTAGAWSIVTYWYFNRLAIKAKGAIK